MSFYLYLVDKPVKNSFPRQECRLPKPTVLNPKGGNVVPPTGIEPVSWRP